MQPSDLIWRVEVWKTLKTLSMVLFCLKKTPPHSEFQLIRTKGDRWKWPQVVGEERRWGGRPSRPSKGSSLASTQFTYFQPSNFIWRDVELSGRVLKTAEIQLIMRTFPCFATRTKGHTTFVLLVFYISIIVAVILRADK